MHVALLGFIFIALTNVLMQLYKMLHSAVDMSYESSFSLFILLSLVLIWSLLRLDLGYIY